MSCHCEKAIWLHLLPITDQKWQICDISGPSVILRWQFPSRLRSLVCDNYYHTNMPQMVGHISFVKCQHVESQKREQKDEVNFTPLWERAQREIHSLQAFGLVAKFARWTKSKTLNMDLQCVHVFVCACMRENKTSELYPQELCAARGRVSHHQLSAFRVSSRGQNPWPCPEHTTPPCVLGFCFVWVCACSCIQLLGSWRSGGGGGWVRAGQRWLGAVSVCFSCGEEE